MGLLDSLNGTEVSIIRKQKYPNILKENVKGLKTQNK